MVRHIGVELLVSAVLVGALAIFVSPAPVSPATRSTPAAVPTMRGDSTRTGVIVLRAGGLPPGTIAMTYCRPGGRIWSEIDTTGLAGADLVEVYVHEAIHRYQMAATAPSCPTYRASPGLLLAHEIAAYCAGRPIQVLAGLDVASVDEDYISRLQWQFGSKVAPVVVAALYRTWCPPPPG